MRSLFDMASPRPVEAVPAFMRSWGLRRRILVPLCGVLLAVGLAGHWLSAIVEDRKVAVFEARDAASRFDRTLLAVNQSVDTMLPMIKDNAIWDDTFAHLRKASVSYLALNYTPASMRNLEVDDVLFMTLAGEFHSGVSLRGNEVLSLSANSQVVQDVKSSLRSSSAARRLDNGLLITWVDRRPVAIAYAGVRRSDSGPEVAGWMLMVRDLGRTAGALGFLTGMKFSYSADAQVAEHERAVRLSDSQGDSTVYLKVQLPPVLDEQDKRGHAPSLLTSLAMVAVALVVVAALLDWLVLRRLACLSEPSHEDDGDEIDALERAINARVQEQQTKR